MASFHGYSFFYFDQNTNDIDIMDDNQMFSQKGSIRMMTASCY